MAMKIMVLVLYNIVWTEAYIRTKWHLDPSSRLATIDMGRKLGGAAGGRPAYRMYTFHMTTSTQASSISTNTSTETSSISTKYYMSAPSV